jgi:DNA-binding IclR family transcriptional regulator
MSLLANAAQVLRCFNADATELTVTDVTERLEMPKANASRLLKQMREAGLLETIGSSKRHRPGRLLLDLGAAFRASSQLIRMAGEVVGKTSRECGHTGYVSIRDGREVTAILDFPGTNALRVFSAIGRRLPAHASATGRTLLARLDDAEIRRLYPNGPPAVSAQSPRDISDLIDRLNSVRESGYAISHQEATAGVDAVAVAVGDPATDELVSLCIVFPASVVERREREKILRSLMAGAEEIAKSTNDAIFATFARR